MSTQNEGKLIGEVNRKFDQMQSEDGVTGRTRGGSPKFYELLQEMAQTHDLKGHDYADNENPFGNYKFAGQMALMFSHSPDDAGFFGRLAEKVYRLANLEKDGKIPKTDTIEDTERDIATIATLWMASRRVSRANSSMKLERITEDQQKLADIRNACQVIEVVSQIRDPKQLYDLETYIHEIRHNKTNDPRD